MKRTRISSRLTGLVLLLVFAAGLTALSSLSAGASSFSFVDQPEDVLIDEGTTSTLHWSVDFTPENNDTFFLVGGNIEEGLSLKIYTSFRYDSGSAMEFAANLPEMNISIDENWISPNPYRIKMRDPSGGEQYSGEFYIRYAPPRFIIQPETAYVPAGDLSAKVPILWAVNFTPEPDAEVSVYIPTSSAPIVKDASEFFTNRAGDGATPRQTMEVMADASMINEKPYRIVYHLPSGDTIASDPFYIYPEGMPHFVLPPQDVLIVDGADAAFSWSIDVDPVNYVDSFGHVHSVFLFTGGNVYNDTSFPTDEMLSILGGSWITAPGEHKEMSVTATSGWVSEEPYTMYVHQKGCPNLVSEPFYVRAAHTVRFVQNEYGWSIPDQIVVDGKCASEPILASSVTGYTFGGWYSDEAFTQRYDFETPVTEALTLYAKWNINYYRVEYDACGGTPNPPPMAVSYRDTISAPTEPVREGGVFKGWYLDPEYTHIYEFGTPVTEPIKLYAKWDIPVYTVYFQNQNIGTQPPAQRIEYGGKAVRPDDPVQGGYIFGGWYIDGAEYDFSAPVKRSLVLWAKWTKICTLTFDAGGGTGAMTPKTVMQRENYTVPECGFKAPEGKRFKYWAVSGETNYKFPGQSLYIEGDKVFTAIWENVPTRTIRFIMNGHGTPVEPMQVEWRTVPAGPPASPSEDGWTFTGWYTTKIAADTASSYYLYDFTKPLLNDTTLYAGWKDNSLYEIHLSCDGSGYGSAELAGEGVRKLNDETYLAHPGTVIDVVNIVPAAGSVTGYEVWGSDWIRAGTMSIGGTKRFTMPTGEIYVSVRFTMKPVESGGHLHNAETLVHHPEAPATCTTDGCMDHYECPICGQWFYIDYKGDFSSVFSVEYYTVHAAGHVPGEPVREHEVPATCTADGSCDLVIYCTECHEVLERTFTVLPSSGHAWGAVEYEWASDHSSVTATRVCGTEPSHVETETVSAGLSAHSEATCEYSEWNEYASDSFSNPAFAAQTLTVEGAKALGHDWDDGYVAADPTCEDDGVRVHTCSRCHETFEEPIAHLGHIWSDVSYTWSADHSTCTASAVCTRDPSHTASERVSTTYEIRSLATCEAPGLAAWSAVFVSPIFEEQTAVGSLPALSHVPGAQTQENMIPPTCTENGSYELVVRCAHCSKVLSSTPQPIAALGHDWGAWTVIKPATAAADGIEEHVCSRCHDSETRPIPKLPPVSAIINGRDDGDTLHYSISPVPEDALMIAVRYEDGMMTDIQVVDAAAAGTFTMGGSGAEYSLFLIDDAEMIPLGDAWSN